MVVIVAVVVIFANILCVYHSIYRNIPVAIVLHNTNVCFIEHFKTQHVRRSIITRVTMFDCMRVHVRVYACV